MLHLRHSPAVRLKCPRHPLYNPQQGRAAIRGGCAVCEHLLEIHRTHMLREQLIRDFAPLADRVQRQHAAFAVRGGVMQSLQLTASGS